jgi:hypothetical protein
MAVKRPIANAAVEEEERTLRVTIETPRSGAYSVSVIREVLRKDSGGRALSSELVPQPVDRKVANVIQETVTLASGTIVKVVDVMEAISLICDRWASEDVTARSATPVAPFIPDFAQGKARIR